MGKQTFDINTVGYGNDLGQFFDFYINNTFYLLAPDYYYSLYSIYFRRCLSVFDGWVTGWHNRDAGLVPQKMLQSVAQGLNNMVYSQGIDFNGTSLPYQFAIKWANSADLCNTLKRAHFYAIAGGTSLLKLNRIGKNLYVSGHRFDEFFADMDSSGKIVGCKIYYDTIQNTNKDGQSTNHYGICEERYFNEEHKPCVRTAVYQVSSNLQTSVGERPENASKRIRWDSLPANVKQYIKTNHPNIVVDKEQYLPFPDSLGLYVQKFTDCIPQMPSLKFGQPIGDILFTESFQFDQMKYFEKNEVDLARARALIPDTMWNKDDPDYDSRALNERFYQKVSSLNADDDKVTPIQFLLRGNDMKTQMENIYKDIAFKLNVSASSVASFLSEGAGARTATEIVSERTKTDTWISSQILLNAPQIDKMLETVMRYYGQEPVKIILKSEDQSPFLEKLKTNSDVFAVGNMSPEMFVRKTYKNLSTAEQENEITYLENERALREQMQTATAQAYNQNNNKQ